MLQEQKTIRVWVYLVTRLMKDEMEFSHRVTDAGESYYA